MRWSKQIIHSKEDRSSSHISSRSMNSFKKVDLSKPQSSQVTPNHNDKNDRSIPKLTSVQKIKTTQLNKSYISQYMNSNNNQANYSIQRNSQQINKVKQQNQNFMNFTGAKVANSEQYRSSQKIIYSDFGATTPESLHEKSLNNYAIKSYESSNMQNLASSYPRFGKTQINTIFTQKLTEILNKFKYLIEQFKEVTDKIQYQISGSILNDFNKYKFDLSNYFNNFQHNLKNQASIISCISNDKMLQHFPKYQFQAVKQIQYQNNEKNKQSRKFQKILTFPSQQNLQKQQTISRPNRFKNQFKQMLNSTLQAPSQKTQIFKNQFYAKLQTSNHQQKQNLAKKLFRKGANTERNYPYEKNESSSFNELDSSISSIKYQKLRDKSGSKSVKNLQHKIQSIKKLINLPEQSEKIEEKL